MSLSPDQLARLDETKEVHIETSSDRGSTKTIIWIVVVGDEVYVRSVRGHIGAWYQRALADPRVSVIVGDDRIDFDAVHITDPDVIETVSDALRAKYPAGGSLDRMTRAEVLDTTLRLEPVS
jgi:hypothetical protein